MDGDWIPASRAYEIVAGAIGFRAAAAICSRANDDLIVSRATRLVWGDRTLNNVKIPAEFWWARGDLALEQNWASGDFETWIDRRVHCRAYGVEFRREDIEAMVPNPEPSRPRLDRSKPGNFASAKQCRHELQKALECDEPEAEMEILRGCRVGFVSASCSNISWRVTDRYGAADYEDANVAVPDWFWDHCVQSPDSVLNWSTGRFAGKGFFDGNEYKAKLSGVQFRVSDIVELEDLKRRPRRQDEAAIVENAGGAAAGRRRSDQWRPWVAELVAHIHEHGYPEGVGSQGQEELIQAVADALAKRGQESLARSTVQPIIQAVLNRFRTAGN